MSSSINDGHHQDERGKNCVDGDLNTKCVSLPVDDTSVTYRNERFPWIALNLGGFQQETEQFVDVSRVEVTIGENIEAKYAVYVAKLQPASRLFQCFREGTGACHNYVYKKSTHSNPSHPNYIDPKSLKPDIDLWLSGSNLLEEKNGSFKDRDTFSVSRETGSGGTICWERVFS